MVNVPVSRDPSSKSSENAKLNDGSLFPPLFPPDPSPAPLPDPSPPPLLLAGVNDHSST